MKKLLAKIRKLLRDRRTRRIITRFVSITAAIVVFVTTYALVLPAITMESEAYCGIPAHQHDDSCYELQLTCEKPETEGHAHTDACYSVSKVLTCETEEHEHGADCYDEAGKLVCGKEEHIHSVDDGCYKEERVLTCELAESEGHVHTDDCYEKVLTCGKEVHTHSTECYVNPDSGTTTDAAVEVSSGGASTGASSSPSISVDDGIEYGNEAAGAGSTEQSENASTALTTMENAVAGVTADGQYVPALEALDISRVLNKNTGIYYHSVADGETVEDSTQIGYDGWTRVDNHTELGVNGLLRVYLAYKVPAGSLNATNQVSRYRLPANLHLTDSQVEAINKNINGIAGGYVNLDTLEILDVDKYYAYLGVEAVEGTRRPDQDPNEYLQELSRRTGTDAAEYISALIRVENVYDEQTGDYLGQDLVFTWTPYSIEKNQHEYDSSGQPTKAGQEIDGWVTLDFNLSQVDLVETAVDTFEREIETVDDHSVEVDTSEEAAENTEEDETGSAAATVETVERREQTADVVFVAEGRDENNNKIHEISTALTIVEDTVVDVHTVEEQETVDNQDAENAGEGATEDAVAATTEEAAVDDQGQASESNTGVTAASTEEDKTEADLEPVVIMPAMSFNDTITVRTGKPAGVDENAGGTVANAADSLPEEAAVTVRVEADEGTFPAGTTMKLAAVDQKALDDLADTLAETVENTPAGSTDSTVSNDNEKVKETEQADNASAAVDNHSVENDTQSGEQSEATETAENTEDQQSENAKEEQKNLKTYGFQAVDITFVDAEGNEVEPAKPARVALTSETVEQAKKDAESSAVTDPVVVHVDDDGNAEQMDLVDPEEIEPAQGRSEEELLEESKAAADTASTADEKTEDKETASDATVDNTEAVIDENETDSEATVDDHTVDEIDNSVDNDTEAIAADEQLNAGDGENAADSSTVGFTTDSFSVYAIVYTVDFHYDVDGQTYDYSIKGGDVVGLKELLPVLNVITDDTATENVDEVQTFINDIEDVRFSDESLVKVARIDTDTTAGQLKEKIKNETGAEPEYSADLTEEQIAQMDAKEMTAPDWALVSMRAFQSDEMLTVTMKSGEVWTIRVTDASGVGNSLNSLTKVISYNNTAMISTIMQQYGCFSTQSPASGNEAKWTFEYTGTGSDYYIKSSDGKYVYINTGNNTGDVSLVNSNSSATRFYIETENGKYRMAVRSADGYGGYYTSEWYLDYEPTYFKGAWNTYANNAWLTLTDYVEPTVYDNVGDWLLYFDDDFSEITIHVGETITLRPYNKWEWKEGNVDVQTAHWNVGGSTWSDWSISSSDNNGDKFSNATDGPFEFTRYVKYDNQLETHYWSVQGRATQTGTYTLKNTKDTGKTITVHVVDGAPVNQPKTINKIANIKVNLFDYDNGGALDVGLNSNNEANHNLANDTNYKSESVNQMGGASHFYFLSSGSGNNNNESWNSYTKDASNPNIVQGSLDSEGYPVLSHNDVNTYPTHKTSLKYLFDTSTASQSWHGGDDSNGMIAYPDVVGMFQKDAAGYYYFNSNTNYFYYDTATGTSKLYEHTYTQTSSADKNSLVNDKPIGFFPFHDYDATDNLYVNQNKNLNHHVGMSMEVEFMLSSDRLDKYGNPIIFDFSGDDDLWVFMEWVDDQGVKHSKLMLDLGGVHQPIHGQINFTDDQTIVARRPYTLKVFYLERGGCDSNCSIRFNLPIIQELAVAKKLTGLTEAEKAKYKNEEFTYEVVVNGRLYNGPTNPEKTIRRNAAGQIVDEDFTITNGQITIKDGETVSILYLDRSDKFSVAEVKTDNMDNFEVPNAERYYHLPHDASLYEEEIALTASHSVYEPEKDDWVTPTYDLEDTEKVTFTNTLKEKNLEVEKKWIGEKDHPNSIDFTVSATIEDDNGARQSYAVSELRESNGADKVFTLSANNNWREEIEHLPVNTPDGKFIFYDINEGYVEGYALTGTVDLTADEYFYCNIDVVKLWPDSNDEHTEVLTVVLKNSAGKYYAGVNAKDEAVFVDNKSDAITYDLKPENNYSHRFKRVPAGTYTAEQVNDDEFTEGLATYVRNIIQYQLENTPLEEQVDPTVETNAPEIHKRIDALRDGIANPDSAHTGEDLTDLYRLYLDYKINSLQGASGVDLLFIIDHSGSMNNTAWQGNPNRAPAVMQALNGENGLISQFLALSEKNQWAAVGFKGPDGMVDYSWSLGNPWAPRTVKGRTNAGENGSEILSPGGTSYVFSRTASGGGNSKNYVNLPDEGANILTNYTAGLWRAEQFLLKDTVKNDGRKKVVVFISDGIPTLHIDCANSTLAGAGTAAGSDYYRDAYGGCPEQTLTEFGYFVNDMTTGGYTFGDNLEFYTIGFGGSMQTANGAELLTGMLDSAYGADEHEGHFMTIDDTPYSSWGSNDVSGSADKLKEDLRKIMGMDETFSNIVIQDDLSRYVSLFASESEANLLKSAKAKVTMTDPDDPTKTVVLWENGSASNDAKAKFTKASGAHASIISRLEYDATTKTVNAVFDPEYKAVAGITYTLSFDVKATEDAYTTYANSGYDRYTEGEHLGEFIKGDPDTDYKGTSPANSTSSGKEGFRSNDGAKATYKHNGEDEEKTYPHPVVQVFNASIQLLKIDQTGKPLTGATFALYKDAYDASGTAEAEEANAANLVKANMQSTLKGDEPNQVAEISVTALKPGTYYLVETGTPDGYNSIEPIKIVVTVNTSVSNGVTSDTVNVNATQSGNALTNFLERPGNGNSRWVLKVQNTAGVELPSAGGPGTKLIYLAGALLSLFGALMLMGKKIRV